MQCSRTDIKIDETRTRNLNFVDQFAVGQVGDDFRGNLARVFAERFCKAHCDVSGKLTMASIASTLDCCADR